MEQTTTTDQRRELNTALALLAKQGNTVALAQLWEINRPVIRRMFWKWYNHNQGIAEAAGLTLEDFEQEGYFAVVGAVEQYDPERGSFLTILQYLVKKQIRSITCGEHCRRKTTQEGREIIVSANPLNDARRLEEPLPGSEEPDGMTYGDSIPDPTATQRFENVEQACYMQELRAVLDKALSMLSERQRTVISRRFFEGLTLKQVGQQEGVTAERVRSIEAEALRSLRYNAQLRKFYGEELLARAYQGNGFSAWSRYGSTPERLAERTEELQKQLAQSSISNLAAVLGVGSDWLQDLLEQL